MKSVVTSLFLLVDRSETARRIQAIQRGVLDPEAMKQLLSTLVRESGSVSDRHLRWLTEIIEVRSDPGEGSDPKRLLFDIYRSANWELQNRYRTV